MGEIISVQLVLSVIAVICAIVYLWAVKSFKYWSKKGLPTVKPTFPFGNFGSLLSGVSIIHSITKVYEALKGSGAYAGYYLFTFPALIVLDPEAIKNITVKDFQFFQDRGVYYNEKDDPVSAHLFAIEGQKWKTLRAKLSPTFTSGKMKMMFPTMTEKTSELRKHMKEAVSKSAVLEMKDILARFTTDMIGSCALGIQCNSLADPDSEFRVIGKKVFKTSIIANIKVAFGTAFGDLARYLGITTTDAEISNFFRRVVSETVKFREENNITRNDFMQLLIQLKNKGCLEGEEGKTSMQLAPLTMEEVSAQAFVFHGAGFETSSSAMGFCLFEMALNTDVQNKLRSEINRVLEKHGGYNYEALMDMNYLDMVIYGKYVMFINLIQFYNVLV